MQVPLLQIDQSVNLEADNYTAILNFSLVKFSTRKASKRKPTYHFAEYNATFRKFQS